MSQYWVQLASDERDGAMAMSDVSTRLEAAEAYARLLDDESTGTIAAGVIRVWEDGTYERNATHFDYKIVRPNHVEIEERQA